MSLLCENIQNQHTDELHLSSRTLLGAPDLRRVLILNMKEGHMSTVHDSSAQLGTQGQDQDQKPPMSHLATMNHDETISADQGNEYITSDSQS